MTSSRLPGAAVLVRSLVACTALLLGLALSSVSAAAAAAGVTTTDTATAASAGTVVSVDQPTTGCTPGEAPVDPDTCIGDALFVVRWEPATAVQSSCAAGVSDQASAVVVPEALGVTYSIGDVDVTGVVDVADGSRVLVTGHTGKGVQFAEGETVLTHELVFDGCPAEIAPTPAPTPAVDRGTETTVLGVELVRGEVVASPQGAAALAVVPAAAVPPAAVPPVVAHRAVDPAPATLAATGIEVWQAGLVAAALMVSGAGLMGYARS